MKAMKKKLVAFFSKDHPSGKTWKRRLGEGYIVYKYRSARGNTITNEVTGIFAVVQKAGILLLLINQYLHWLVPVWLVIIIWFAQKIFEYILGWWDQKYLKWCEFETRYATEVWNPYNRELLERVKTIEKHLNKNYKENY